RSAPFKGLLDRRLVLAQARSDEPLEHRVAHVGGDEAGMDRVHSNAVAEVAEFHRGGLGQQFHCALAAAVGAQAREAPQSCYRGQVDYRAAAAGSAAWLHGPCRSLQAEEDARHIDIQDALKVA